MDYTVSTSRVSTVIFVLDERKHMEIELDIYRYGASLAFEVPFDQVTKQQRQAFKERFFLCSHGHSKGLGARRAGHPDAHGLPNATTQGSNIKEFVEAVADMMHATSREPVSDNARMDALDRLLEARGLNR